MLDAECWHAKSEEMEMLLELQEKRGGVKLREDEESMDMTYGRQKKKNKSKIWINCM